jgi:hypothetical protein
VRAGVGGGGGDCGVGVVVAIILIVALVGNTAKEVSWELSKNSGFS